jgi:glutathione-independent formaldehyde dehydrogenase
VPFDISLYLAKGLRMGSVQANVKDYNRQLRASSPPARPVPGFCVSHNLGLDETPDAHQHFDIRD